MVTIVNHSLLFSLMGAGFGPSDEKGGVMFSNDFVIFDEAHEIPDVAGDHLGLGISSWAMEMGVKRIYNSKKRKGLSSYYVWCFRGKNNRYTYIFNNL